MENTKMQQMKQKDTLKKKKSYVKLSDAGRKVYFKEVIQAYRNWSYWVIGGMFIGFISLKVSLKIGKTYGIYMLKKYRLIPAFAPPIIVGYHGYKIKTYTIRKAGIQVKNNPQYIIQGQQQEQQAPIK